MTGKKIERVGSSRRVSVAQSSDVQQSQQDTLENYDTTGWNTTAQNTSPNVTPSPSLDYITPSRNKAAKQPLHPAQSRNEPPSGLNTPHSTQPGRIEPERLAFLNQRDTNETRTRVQPGHLADQSIRPYTGPSHIETGIPRYTNQNWKYIAHSPREQFDSDGSDHSISSSRAPKIQGNKPDLFPSISAFEYAIAPYLDRSPFSTSPDLSPSDSFASSSSHSEAPTFNTTQHENLYPGPDLDPSAYIDGYLQDLSIEQRVLLTLWRTIMTRCIVLATPVVDHQTRRITVSIVNYDRTCNAIRDYALPIADRLHHIVPLHGLCWYWLGRGEAGLQDFDAAIQDFEKAIACGFSKLGQVSESVQAERAKFWLEKVREEKRINEQTNRPSLRRLDSDLDAINFSTQDGDYAKVDYSAKQQGPGWYRENAAGAREFTKKELEEIEKIPENVQKMVLKKELSLAQSTWEICQRKQSDWLSLYERLDQMKPPKDTTDDICT